MNELEFVKENLIKELAFHKKHCDSTENCGVLACLLYRLAELAGCPLTKEEKIL
jgi:hypothetical protein